MFSFCHPNSKEEKNLNLIRILMVNTRIEREKKRQKDEELK